MKLNVRMFLLVSLLGSFMVWSQSKMDQDLAAIKGMCGCYAVKFNFAETFQYSEDSSYKASKVKHDKALEWVQLVSDSVNQVQLQHLLVVGNPADPMVIKHWRQDWIFENSDFYQFNHDNQWDYIQKSTEEVAGQWTQRVFQVDDSPRYEGSASWVHVDGKSFWENATDSPLPRREYTKREDYNVTFRRNRHEINTLGWIHDQDNDKIIRKEGEKDILLAQEKGYNTYTKVDDTRCKAAQDWWKENQTMWKNVRHSWEKIFQRKKNLSLHAKVDGKPLYRHLFAMEKSSDQEAIETIINSFLKE